jgi:hypothetical protein
MGDTEDRNDVSGQWNDEQPLITWVDSPSFQWLRVTFRLMLAMSQAEYPKTDEDEATNKMHLCELRSNKFALP